MLVELCEGFAADLLVEASSWDLESPQMVGVARRFESIKVESPQMMGVARRFESIMRLSPQIIWELFLFESIRAEDLSAQIF